LSIPDLSSGQWTAVGLLLGVVSLAATLAAWWFPRHPRRSAHEAATALLLVEVSNHLPVFDEQDGSQRTGEWLVAVTLRNRGPAPVLVRSWGIELPGQRNLVVPGRTTSFEPALPHWVQPSTSGTWYVEAVEVRQRAAEQGVSFEDMTAWVALDDGRRFEARRGLPLS
jgi:hypothetical protein